MTRSTQLPNEQATQNQRVEDIVARGQQAYSDLVDPDELSAQNAEFTTEAIAARLGKVSVQVEQATPPPHDGSNPKHSSFQEWAKPMQDPEVRARTLRAAQELRPLIKSTIDN